MPVGRPQKLFVGQRSGTIVLISFLRRDKRDVWLVCYKCDCGAELECSSTAFTQKRGCPSCAKKIGVTKRTKHGASKRGLRDPLYTAYKGMLSRCYNPKTRAYKWYGAKGVRVCAEWHDFGTFRTWAMANGYQPGLTIDREFENQDYSPTNCSYVSQSENSKRMRAKYHFVPKSAIFYDEPTFGDF